MDIDILQDTVDMSPIQPQNMYLKSHIDILTDGVEHFEHTLIYRF